MCLAVPGKLVEAELIGENRVGTVQFGGIKRTVFLDFVPEAKAGDYVLVHVGFAISRLDEEEAQRTYQLLERIGMLETDPELESQESKAMTEARTASLAGTLDAIH
jgi:hydrogenase expression/formation protein HypC